MAAELAKPIMSTSPKDPESYPPPIVFLFFQKVKIMKLLCLQFWVKYLDEG